MNRRITLASTLAALLAINLAGCTSFAGRAPSLQLGRRYDLETQFSVARLHERQGRLTQARELYEKILKDEPKNSDACHRLAVVLTRLDKHDDAVPYYLRAAKLDPRNPEILADLGYALFLQDDLGAAELSLQEALAIDTSHKRSIGNLALVRGHQGRFDESMALFRRVVGEAEANANLAFVHMQRGEGQLAIERYGRALTLDSNLKPAAQALVQIAALQQRAKAVGRGIDAQQRPNSYVATAESPVNSHVRQAAETRAAGERPPLVNAEDVLSATWAGNAEVSTPVATPPLVDDRLIEEIAPVD